MKNLASIATLLEKIFLVGLLLGGIFILLKMRPFDVTVTTVSLFGLALACFLSAYRPTEMPREETKLAGFKELLTFIIVPKVLWISAAVSLTGIGLLVLGSDPKGYHQLLFIGGTTIAVALALAAVVSLGSNQAWKTLAPAVIRAVPLMCVDFFLLVR